MQSDFLLTILGLFFLPAAAGALLLVYGLHFLFVGVLIAYFEGLIDLPTLFTSRYLLLITAFVFAPEVLIGGILGAIVVNSLLALLLT